MTVFVPFDGSPLSTAALDRASELADTLGKPLVAVSVVPRSHRVAVETGWIAEGELFDVERVVGRLRRRANSIAPDAELQITVVDGHLTTGGIARRLRDAARDVDADLVVVGSENVTRSISPVDTVGGHVAARLDMDVYVVQEEATAVGPLAEQAGQRERTGSSAPSL